MNYKYETDKESDKQEKEMEKEMWWLIELFIPHAHKLKVYNSTKVGMT